jgi:hypothetical protein
MMKNKYYLTLCFRLPSVLPSNFDVIRMDCGAIIIASNGLPYIKQANDFYETRHASGDERNNCIGIDESVEWGDVAKQGCWVSTMYGFQILWSRLFLSLIYFQKSFVGVVSPLFTGPQVLARCMNILILRGSGTI